LNTHTIVADIHQNMLKTREVTGGQGLAVSGIRSLYIVEWDLTVT